MKRTRGKAIDNLILDCTDSFFEKLNDLKNDTPDYWSKKSEIKSDFVSKIVTIKEVTDYIYQ